ncbi:hypothetical protein OG871_35745 [Kitasatospora sp. NBC_00374]|uniref:hypothetical protein n=1 Tax=Kitasatospora sp. NBC_00374 TaxID=2975964 RepID=UPI0032564CA6
MQNARSLRRVLITGVIVASFAAGGWGCYAWVVPGLAGPSTTAEVDAASRRARTAAQQRLDETMAALPGGLRTLGDAATDRCLRDGPFEGAEPGLLQCQWELARYVVVDDKNIRAIGGNWSVALSRQRWSDSGRNAPPGWNVNDGRYDFDDPQTNEHLVVDLVRNQADLDSLQDARSYEGVQEYERERRGFTARAAAAQALAEGRTVAQVSLSHAYHREGGGTPVPVD